MSLSELEAAVSNLPVEDLNAFAQWFEEFLADAWDKQIEADASAGKLDDLAKKANAAFDAGQCKPVK